MRLSSRTWFVISLILLGAAAWSWKKGDEAVARNRQQHSQPPAVSTNVPGTTAQSLPPEAFRPLLSRAASSATQPRVAAGHGSLAPVGISPDPRFPNRLQNTTRSLAELGRSEQAILLRNALIDTSTGIPLAVPDPLKSDTDPGSYIVQARGPITDQFRTRLAASGGQIVSYIPNNAYLVRMSAGQAQGFAQTGEAQAVLPYEPYYKLESDLLALAVDKQPLPEGKELVVAVFPGTRDDSLQNLKKLGAQIVREDKSPFGPLIYVKPAADTLVAMARMNTVQGIEPSNPRALMNDLSRVALNVATDTVVSNNFLGLTGDKIVVNVNDTGVDAAHPDLAPRVLTAPPAATQDWVGHGTHVAGTIASSGEHSSTITNAVGSLTNASFRGIAPAAKIFPLLVFLATGPEISDTFVQETTAMSNTLVFRRTNAIVSNNSWGYVADPTYNFATAGYDAAVRDALPAIPGEQPVLYVFAAGNNGFGEDNGQGGLAGSVSAPGTGKNVITVAAAENFREITNAIFAGYSDSFDQIASFSSRGNVGIGIEGPNGRFKPDVCAPGTFVVSTRSSLYNPIFGDDLDALNEALGPYYLYESGTSMAAPNISGVLALMQEFFEQVLQRSYSPALLKALLINGARSLGSLYDVSPANYLNYQGWGLANLTNSLPEALTNRTSEASWPMRFIDESPTNALATGQSRSWSFQLAEAAQQNALRISLVWTDPPGNPAASIKLVNDLDLVLTNIDTGESYVGNLIPQGADFSQIIPSNSVPYSITNPPPAVDYVNNVENIFLRAARGSNFVVTVRAHRVNVNAINSNTNAIAQDFALVISSGVEPGVESIKEFKFEPLLSNLPTERSIITFTNGIPLLNQHVGANLALTNSVNGSVEQWNFYRFDNSLPPSELSGLTNGSNVAFITFIPPNLSRARSLDADIDLYVSKDPSLTNLNPSAVANAFKSLNQGGTEVVFFTNATLADVYYVAVKSEDQMAAEFGIVGLSTDIPFDELDENGNHILNGLPPVRNIPDGSPELPSAVYQFSIVTTPFTIVSTVVTNTIWHERVGDLYGHLSHGNTFAVLNNHRVGDDATNTLHNWIYDDGNTGQFLGAQHTDGPGSLDRFTGQQAFGLPFILAMSDNAQNQTGRVQTLKVRLEPNKFTEGNEINDFVLPGQYRYYFVDITPDVSRLRVLLSNMSDKLNVYFRRDLLPTDTDYDKFALIDPPSGELAIGMLDVPPLTSGRWFIGVYNPNGTTVSYTIKYLLERNVPAALTQSVTSDGGPFAISDDIVQRYPLLVTNARPVSSVSVGVRIDHPRAADLTLRLISPLGEKILLAENRGGLSTTGYGYGTLSNMVYAGFTDNTNDTALTGPIKFATPPFGTNNVPVTNILSTFEGVARGSHLAGTIVDGWDILTNVVGGITNNNVTVPPTVGGAHGGTNYLDLESGRIARKLPTVAGRHYLLRFYMFGGSPARPIESELTLGDSSTVLITNVLLRTTELAWQLVTVPFSAPASTTPLEIRASLESSMRLDDFELVEFGGTKFYTPEEPLKPLVGQPGVGTWQLEILDNRAGPVPATTELLSWQLNFVFAPTNPPAVLLTNGVPYSGTVSGPGIQYFMVDVPRSASMSTNLLVPTSGGDLVLLYNESGLPDGSQAGDVVVDYFGAGNPEFLLLDKINPPKLRPGQRYYLGVANANPTEVNDFILAVAFDRTDTNQPNVAVLSSGVPVQGNIGVTNAMDYYQFIVSSNANDVQFQLVPTNGNVNLYVRKWSPAANPLPTPGVYDYRSERTGTNADIVLVETNSFPTPLSPGIWYVGVLNVDTQAVGYTLTATEVSTTSYTYVTLTDDVPVTPTLAATNQWSTVYQLPIATTNPAVRIELSNVSESARIYADFNRVPGPFASLGSMAARPGQSSVMILRTNLTLPSLNGNLNLVVRGSSASDLTFTLRVTLLTNDVPLVTDLASGVPATGRLPFNPTAPEIDYYHFVASGDVRWIDVELTPVDGNVDIVLKRDLPLPTDALFSYTSANLGLSNDLVRVTRLSLPEPAQAGDWYIGVLNRSAGAASYSLRVSETLNSDLMTLPAGTTLTNVVLDSGTDYYRLPVSDAATKAVVRVTVLAPALVDDVGTYLRKGLPLPSAVLTDYLPFVHDPTRIFVVATNSTPIPLSGGDWYLAVGNNIDQPVGYEVSFTESTNDLSAPNIIPSVTFQTSAKTVIAWYSESGHTYYVEGSTNGASGPWTAVSSAIRASGNQASRSLPLDTPYRYFRVIEGIPAPLTVGTPAILPGGGLQMSWSGYIGAVYEIQTSTDLLSWQVSSTIVATSESNTVTLAPSVQPNTFYRLFLRP